MRRILLITLPVVLASTAAVADAAPRSGTTSEGVRITLDGRTVSMRVPAAVRRRARVEISCGAERPARPGRLATRTVAARPGQRLRVKLPAAAAGSELCGYSADGTSGAAYLGPPPAAPPPVLAGPDVRQGETRDFDELEGSELEGDAGLGRFLLRGQVLTVRLARAFRRSTIVTLVCRKRKDIATFGVRNVVVRRGRRVVTGDLGPVRPDIDYCLIEDDLAGGDIAVAIMGAPGGAAPIADPPPEPRPVIAAGQGPPPRTLQKQTLRAGPGGRRSRTGDELLVDYVGANWSDGREFDTSWERGDPFSFALDTGMVIPGWDKGLVGMQVGERRRLVIPPDMAYGRQGSPPDIGPDETLIFVVDLVRIRRPGSR